MIELLRGRLYIAISQENQEEILQLSRELDKEIIKYFRDSKI